MPAAPKIGECAAIGDGRSVALVSRGGAIDWLCWPRFDSPSLFAALLDSRVGGTWVIAPTESSQQQRRYLPETNILETRFVTDGGSIVVTDFMPVTSESKKRLTLWPEQELLRRVTCERGEVWVTLPLS